ncbi:MAG: hypothetical protein COZ46_01935 [Verrucomicrobia bacterium CG_4_10_14_3_um_filter_43_23]|nr:MAG: hypothetical protein AUJ82_01950 [Verrucomicrobia bacterium CG1_02_43_26]PIP59658.1 MAG: hypothetical protein COX01_03540 [Verrucomicrobia bacterium CG22_combo_CG10-13_8_21_14_all_43_17]PIX58957.1 MAG: hypothetical protein COZ46_01935 [Verrucomicrobia bacterium CG_4_10_14_3_um_filter_43_23]PIY63102.1 MAG: hypothetical protein COY94_00285 [Verrucomicrobia bacterium CG_4_10_14_0_8_um_filter_43_34]PJA43609.1 MAG: hypothetical protein CO175_07210 [Verrucomicrobia bacterium CG_4_9_14_3_um_fi
MSDISNVAVIGCGLLGGSIIRALRKHRIRVFSWDKDEVVNQYCMAQLGCTVLQNDFADISHVDVVVVCVPIDHMESVFKRIQPHITPHCLVTDVGSTKQRICQIADSIFDNGNFVGAHPMAGSEKSGIMASDEAIFIGKLCFITASSHAQRHSIQVAKDFWSLISLKLVEVDPVEHDEIVAGVSHFPQCVASLLSAFLLDALPSEWGEYAGNGLRDTTRIAASNPDIWIPIIQENRENIQKLLVGFKEKLAQADLLLQNNDLDAFKVLLEAGQIFRKDLDR